MTRAALLITLCLAAAACQDRSADPAQEGAGASGEVLEGSISDAMIPLEQLNSQAPLAPRAAPPVGDVDAEQPEVEPAPGINDAPPAPAPAPAPAAPAADQPQE